MEIRDGFIVGIFNYCDRWCEACAFTSRCRLFADQARIEAAMDPNLKAIVDAPLLPQEEPPPPPRWMQELIDEMNEVASRPLTDEEQRAAEPTIRPEHQAIQARAMAYMMAIHAWLKRGGEQHCDPRDPIAVIGWYATLNSGKVYRALIGLADDDGDREFPPDHEGSAKVAIIGVERSIDAWRALAATGAITEDQARPFMTELGWMQRRLDEVFPMARAFVRPGLDEPDEVAALDEDAI